MTKIPVIKNVRSFTDPIDDRIDNHQMVDEMFAKMTPIETIIASHIMYGWDTYGEISQDLGISKQAIGEAVRRIRHRFGNIRREYEQ